MDKTTVAINKVRKWRKNDISIYRIAKELGVVWVTVKRWLDGTAHPSYQISKTIIETEIEL